MKLAPLLTQFLSETKRLDLPGLGSFFLHPTVNSEPERHRHNKPVNLEGVTFENNPAIRESEDLVRFIADQTGKMKALAASDLDSHLELAQQFLNIGKPFLFEGIGSLVKLKSGLMAFSSGQDLEEKVKEYSTREISKTSTTEDSFTAYKNIFSPGREKTRWRRSLAFLLMIAGIAFAIWAGYTVYKTTTHRKVAITRDEEQASSGQDLQAIPENEVTESVDTAHTIHRDSSVIIPQRPGMSNYKIIIEVANARRAADRFAKLKSYQWKIQMETRDSQAYKLFLLLPIAANDTTRVLDSLTVLSGKKVYIEN